MFAIHGSLSLALTAIIIIGSKYTDSFSPSNTKYDRRGAFFSLYSGTVPDIPTDVKIPYDSAALLEYDAWRDEYNKGEFDAERFEIFKINYKIITIANVKAAKERREGKTNTSTVIGLNLYADMTEGEFIACRISSRGRTFQIMRPEDDLIIVPKEGVNFFSKEDELKNDKNNVTSVRDDVKNQTSDIASVEDLEKTLDKIDGVADDRERIRSAYLDWCKQFSRESNEERFKTFSENYLQFETYFNEINFPMRLNRYADLTPDEYKELKKSEGSEAPIEVDAVKEELTQEIPKTPIEPIPTSPEEKEAGYFENIIDTEAISSVYKKAVKAVTSVEIPLPETKDDATTLPKTEEKPKNEIETIKTEDMAKTESLGTDDVKPEEKTNETSVVIAEEGVKVESFEQTVKKTPASITISEPVPKAVIKEEIAKEKPQSTPPKAESEMDQKAVPPISETSPTKVSPEIDQKIAPSIEKKTAEPDASVKFTSPPPATPKISAKTFPKNDTEVADSMKDALSSLFGVGLKPKVQEQSSKTKPAPKAKEIKPTPKVTFQRKAATPSSTKSVRVTKKKATTSSSTKSVRATKRKATTSSSTKSIVSTNAAFSFFSGSKKKRSKAKKEPAINPTSTAETSPNPFSFFGVQEQKKPETKSPIEEQSKDAFSFFSPKPQSKSVSSDVKTNADKVKPASFFSTGKSTPAKKVSNGKKEETKEVDSKSDFLSSLFQSGATTTETKKDTKIISNSNIESSNPVSDAFDTLFGGSKQSSKPASASKAPTSATKSVSAPTPSKSTFSFFSSPAKKNPEPVIAPEATKKASFSFFGEPKEAPPPAPIAKEKKQTFSFFATPKPKAVAPTQAPTPALVKKKATPMFNFGKAAPVKKPVISTSANARASGTFSISKALRNGMKTSIAVITDFSQNPDGSITGKVFNSKNFRDGTTITTSPVPKNSKAGTVVTTSSGTKYQLR